MILLPLWCFLASPTREGRWPVFFFPEGMDMYKLEMILLILISAKTHLQQMIWFHWNFLNLIYITVSTAFSTGGEDVKST